MTTVSIEALAQAFATDDHMSREERYGRLIDLVCDFAQHTSPRCIWPAEYRQWKNGHCPCGLTAALRDAGLPVEWAGGPPA